MRLPGLVLRGLVFALGAATFGLFAFVVWSRFRYPIDGEWMVGTMRDAVGRIRGGESMYVAPSDGFIPFVYPPLYFFASSFVARFTSVFVACKLVSLASTLVVATCIARIGRMLGASRFWIAASVLLFFGSYDTTLMFFDLERVDIFAAMIVMIGTMGLMGSESLARTAVSGALLGLAFFAKQPHILSFGAAVVALFVVGQRKRAYVAAASGAIAFALLYAYMETSSGGWFSFYCVTLPREHGFEPKVLTTFFIVDLPKLALPAAATIAMVVLAIRSKERESAPFFIFAIVTGATMLEAFTLRAHRGGWSNVIIAWTPFGFAAASVVATRLERQSAVGGLAVLAGACLELLGGVFDPGDKAPNADDMRDRTELVAFVHRLEQRGDVVVTTTGNMTTKPHFQIAALYDILRARRPLPDDIAQNLKTRHYAALFVGGPEELLCDYDTCEKAFTMLNTNYFVGSARDEREHSGMSGYDARPRYVMVPRQHAVDGLPFEQLKRRAIAEAGLAFGQMKGRAPGLSPEPDLSIEQRAQNAMAAGSGSGSPTVPRPSSPDPLAPQQ